MTIATGLGLLCCALFSGVLAALMVFLIWRVTRSSPEIPPASATPDARLDSPDAVLEPSERRLPSTASAELEKRTPSPAVGARVPAVVLGGRDPDQVDDFDEDGPTTLIDTSEPAMRALLAEAGLAETAGELAKTERIRRPTESELAKTERLEVPPLPAGPMVDRPVDPPVDSPADPSAIPEVAEPPPLPASHAALPSARGAVLDPPEEPDIQTLKAGATIIPPDDWNEDFIEEDEVDETMLLVRPPLPPKE